PAGPPRDPAGRAHQEYRRSPTQPAVSRGVALQEPRPVARKPLPPRPVSSRPRKRRHPWGMIVLLTVGLIIATYGLVRFGYGPEPKHQANSHPRTSDTTARHKPTTIPSFPLPTHTIGMAINPPYSKSLPPVVQALGRNPGIVE